MSIRSSGFKINRLEFPAFQIEPQTFTHMIIPVSHESEEYSILAQLLQGQVKQVNLELLQKVGEVWNPAGNKYRFGGFFRRQTIQNYLKHEKKMTDVDIAKVLEKTKIDGHTNPIRLNLTQRFLLELEISMAYSHVLYFNTVGCDYNGIRSLLDRFDQEFLSSGGIGICISCQWFSPQKVVSVGIEQSEIAASLADNIFQAGKRPE